MSAGSALLNREIADSARLAPLGGAIVIESLVVGVLVLVWAYFSYGYIEDDAFIHLEFARSVASGRGFAFGALVTNGDTSPLWVLFLALIHALGVGWVASAKIACALGLALAVTGTWRLASDLPRERPAHALLPLAAMAVTILNPYFVHWSFSGMEATAALGLSLWAVWAVLLGTPTLVRFLFGASLLAMGPLLRPELLVFAALLGPVLLWRFWRAQNGKSVSYRLLYGAGLAVLMVIPVCIWCGYALHAFGSVIPNTNIAKRGGATGAIVVRLVQVYAMGFSLTLLSLPLALGRGVRGSRVPVVVWALLAWPAACVAFYIANHTLVQTRYCLVSMPCVTIAVLWLLARVSRPRVMVATAGAMLVASLLVIMAIVIPHVRNKEEMRDKTSAVSTFVRDHIPAGDAVAVMAIGQVEFESRHLLVDLGGITQPAVVPFLNDAAATLHWAKTQGARYFLGPQPEPAAQRVFSVEMPYVGWTLRYAKYRDTEGYGVYRLP
jgi:hypothetical protein